VYKHYAFCPQHTTENQTIMSKEKDAFMVFSCLPQLLISELFSYRFSAFDFRHCRRRTAGKSVKQQSRVVTIEKTKNKKQNNLLKENCPRQPHGALSH